jgi:hypothetical protein
MEQQTKALLAAVQVGFLCELRDKSQQVSEPYTMYGWLHYR